jgi:hypothetical protein
MNSIWEGEFITGFVGIILNRSPTMVEMQMSKKNIGDIFGLKTVFGQRAD